MHRGQPLSDQNSVVWRSPDPEYLYSCSPGLCRLESGRLVATYGERGPGAGDLAESALVGDNSVPYRGTIVTSDDRGRTWTFRSHFQFRHARPFAAGKSVYVIGHAGDLTIVRSDDEGGSWQPQQALTEGQFWHQAPCNVHYTSGCVYLVMEREVYDDIDCWSVSVLAPVLMRGRVADDLTRRESWAFASELAFRDAVPSGKLDYFGVPFYATPAKSQAMPALRRGCAPPGWLETNVVQFVDPRHCWFDADARTFHLWARAHTGGTGYAAIAKVVEAGPEPGTGNLETMLESVPSGRKIVYVPCPGGQMRFHVLYDAQSALYWLLSTQATDSMTRVELLPDERYNLPNNERRRMQLHFSRNMIDWCFAGIVIEGENDRASRHYASMVIDGDDLAILSRSGDANLRNRSNPTCDAHDGNLVTYHRVPGFRQLIY